MSSHPTPVADDNDQHATPAVASAPVTDRDDADAKQSGGSAAPDVSDKDEYDEDNDTVGDLPAAGQPGSGAGPTPLTTEVMRVDRWGKVVLASDATSAQALRIQKKRRETEQAREKKWLKMALRFHPTPDEVARNVLNEFHRKHADVLKRRVRKGIPDSMRAQVWPYLCEVAERKRAAGADNQYDRIVARKADPALERQIKLDRRRTQQQHVLFRNRSNTSNLDANQGIGQHRLYSVLRAYSIYDAQLGYCQSMSSPTAFLISYLDEETAFWVLESMLRSDKYKSLRRLYTHDFPLLHEFLFIHDKFVQRLCPKLFAHLQHINLFSTAYAFRWYHMLFAEFPAELVARIWDILLLEGIKILFRMALLLLKRMEKALLTMDFERAILALQDIQYEAWLEDSDTVITQALAIGMTRKQVESYSQQYAASKTSSSA